MRLRTFLSATVLSTTLLASNAFAGSKVFEVDRNHTFFGFKASTVLFDVPGRFDQYKVQISGDPETGTEAKVRLEINVPSINTENSQRDDHLKSPDFFDANQYPRIVFTSSKVTRNGNKVTVDGTLDMHGVRKDMSIVFDAVSALNGAGNMEHVYKAKLNLNRKDFGVGAESVAAKISLNEQIELNLLLAGFFNEAEAGKK